MLLDVVHFRIEEEADYRLWSTIPLFNSVISLSDEQIDRLFPDVPSTPPSNPIAPVIRLDRAFIQFKDMLRQALYSVLTPAIYVFSADCGTGKSQAVQAVLAEWKAKGFVGGGGAIIFVFTLAEVDAYKDGAGLDRADYAVLTSDPVYSKYGAGMAAAEKVPVLFVTHEKARRVLTGLDSYTDATVLHYRGKPRTLRVREEALLPVEYASFSLYDLMAVPNALKGQLKADADLFHRLVSAAGGLPVGASLLIPSDVRDAADRVLHSKAALPLGARRTLDAVAKLAGSKAHKIDGEADSRFIGTGLPLPADIGPLFVLDASARLSDRYDDWSAYGMEIRRLEPALLTYDPLTIHWCNKGSGKTILRNDQERRVIYKAIADVINSKLDEDFLVILAKAFATVDAKEKAGLPADLLAMLDSADRVQVTTWGRHLSSNDHREVENVILIGAWEYDAATYDAITLAKTGEIEAAFDEEKRRATKTDETTHNLYQAISRCRVRNKVGAVCGAANAYLIMPDRDDRSRKIEEAFPGCSIKVWNPIAPTKESKVDIVLAAILRLTATRMIVPFKEVIEACGSNDRSYLTKVVKSKRLLDELMRHGIKVTGSVNSRKFISSTVGSA